MFFLIWGFRPRVVEAGRGTFHCPVCTRSQTFALKTIARYFTLFFIPIVRTGAAVDYAVCLGCHNALKRSTLSTVSPAGTAPASRERPALGSPSPTRGLAPSTAAAASATPLPRSPRPAAAEAFMAQQLAVAPRPAFGQSAFARATYARKRSPAPTLGAPATSGPSFFTPRR